MRGRRIFSTAIVKHARPERSVPPRRLMNAVPRGGVSQTWARRSRCAGRRSSTRSVNPTAPPALTFLACPRSCAAPARSLIAGRRRCPATARVVAPGRRSAPLLTTVAELRSVPGTRAGSARSLIVTVLPGWIVPSAAGDRQAWSCRFPGRGATLTTVTRHATACRRPVTSRRRRPGVVAHGDREARRACPSSSRLTRRRGVLATLTSPTLGVRVDRRGHAARCCWTDRGRAASPPTTALLTSWPVALRRAASTITTTCGRGSRLAGRRCAQRESSGRRAVHGAPCVGVDETETVASRREACR